MTKNQHISLIGLSGYLNDIPELLCAPISLEYEISSEYLQDLLMKGDLTNLSLLSIFEKDNQLFGLTFVTNPFSVNHAFVGKYYVKIMHKEQKKIHFDLSDLQQRRALAILLNQLSYQYVCRDLGYLLPKDTKTMSKRYSKRVASNRIEPVSEKIYNVTLRDFNQNIVGNERSKYALCDAFSLKTDLRSDGLVIIRISPKYEIFVNDISTISAWNLPTRLKEEWDIYWKMTARSILGKSKPLLDCLKFCFSKTKPELSNIKTIEDIEIASTKLRDPILKFAGGRLENLKSNIAIEEFAEANLRKFHVNNLPKQTFKIQPIIEATTQDKRAPNGFQDWISAFKFLLNQVRTLILNHEESYIGFEDVELLEPIWMEGNPLAFWNGMRNHFENKYSVAALLLLNSSGSYQIAKKYLERIPSKTVLLETIIESNKEKLKDIAIPVALALFHRTFGKLLWTANETNFDLVIGLTRTSRYERQFNSVISVSIIADKVEIIESSLVKLTRGRIEYEENLKEVFDKIEQKWVSESKKDLKNVLLMFEKGRFPNNYQSLNRLDKLKKFNIVAVQISDEDEGRIIDFDTLDTSALGQPSRGTIIQMDDEATQKALLISTGYPDLNNGNIEEISGFARPISVEMVYGKNESVTFDHILQTVFNHTFIHSSALQSLHLPFELEYCRRLVNNVNFLNKPCLYVM